MPDVTEEQLKNKLKNFKQLFREYREAIKKKGATLRLKSPPITISSTTCMARDPWIGHRQFPAVLHQHRRVLPLMRGSCRLNRKRVNHCTSLHGQVALHHG
ncbi:hypothetical protein Pcinc_009266 [Petrolisthes cinctipes]|uniref:Uncharacterized protein n=1 Tax=Petrolisthes cinctipes TaxID=88211 RepID=A0AAE1G521_PETCI|nr:hypothetical protein Pcinc_009266 [Petrolisthes cinctipes]